MTRRRVMVVVVAVAILVVGFAVYRVSNPPPRGPNSPYLTADDFPSGYAVSRLSNTAPPEIGGATAPAECGPVVADQAARQFRATTVGVLAEPSDPTLPTYAQSVVTGGETVAQTRAVVDRCPDYRQRTDTETYTSSSSILPVPHGCPSDALVVRSTTRYAGPSSHSDTTSLTAYIAGRTTVGQLSSALARPESTVPDDFCRLVTLVVDRLD